MSDVSSVSTRPTASDPAYADDLAKLPGFNRKVKTTLDQADFLKVLATQLANQNPLEPTDNADSIAQMATFSSIQQSSELVSTLKSFMAAQGLSSAQGMLGKEVTVTTTRTVEDANGDKKTETTKTTGLVTAVGYDDSGAAVVTVGGKRYPQSSVTEIRNTAASAVSTSA
ncbi:MAG TPA: flagellar hook capping FlgD N-terminal domain-containing protein [Opitutaceae bacterium]|nr:flagellar hook capping FlgD N-terminal domain-containing protein [Opitutaceae bacterium]